MRVDEVGIPYQAFRVLFKYRIIYWIMVLDDVPLAKAYYRWSDAFKFDQHVYDIMNYIIEKEVPMILLNRNPTLNLYSLLRLKIRYIKRPERKETLSLPLGILEGLNADFDGDILNMIALITQEIQRLFRKYDPVRRYMMSRTTGKIDPKFGLTSTDTVNLYNFATMEFPEAKEDEVADKDLDKVFLPYIQKVQKEEELKRLESLVKPKKEFPKVMIPDDVMM